MEVSRFSAVNRARTVVLYTKEECPLCEEARRVLRRLGRELALAIKEVDITTDPTLYAQYRYLIPVAVLPDGTVLAGRFAEKELRRALARDERPS